MNDTKVVEKLVNEAVEAGVVKRAVQAKGDILLARQGGKGALHSSALAGVHSAAGSWTAAKGPWLEYAFDAAQGRIRNDNFRKKTQKKHRTASLSSLKENPLTGELTGTAGSYNGSYPDHALGIADREDLAFKVGAVLARVGPDSRKGRVLSLLTEGVTPTEIADRLGINKTDVSYAIRSLREEVREVFAV